MRVACANNTLSRISVDTRFILSSFSNPSHLSLNTFVKFFRKESTVSETIQNDYFRLFPLSLFCYSPLSLHRSINTTPSKKTKNKKKQNKTRKEKERERLKGNGLVQPSVTMGTVSELQKTMANAVRTVIRNNKTRRIKTIRIPHL